MGLSLSKRKKKQQTNKSTTADTNDDSVRRDSRVSNVRFVLSLAGSHASKKNHKPDTSISTVSGQSVGERSTTANSYHGLVHRIRNHSKGSTSSRASSAAASSTATTKRETTWFDGGSAMEAAVHAAASATGFNSSDALDATLSQPHHDQKDTTDGVQKLIDEQLPKEDEKPVVPKYLSELILMNLYMLPENEPERRKEHDKQQRQASDISEKHYLLKHVWGKNYQIPLKDPRVIVDWCCGTGIWVMEMAQEFPDAQVIGIDYSSAMLPNFTYTKNASFRPAIIHEGDNGFGTLEDNAVDYIMMRDVWLVNSPSHKWIDLFNDIKRILKPGGWIEVYEQELQMYSPGPHLDRFDRWFDKFFENVNIQRNVVKEIGQFLSACGFTVMDERTIELPLGEWCSTTGLKETGYLFKDLMDRRFRTLKLWLSEYNQLTETELLDTLSKGIEECERSKTRMGWRYYSAQKPF
ncbi:hypothetical protein EC973_009131 [Apophysomyces ossiformis]|uniref:Methyltransferase domain-containing protein n=1 Tax=Apophysomyces ossiformis TaxID=679940 RepID=A0A8H7EPR9_9FUNG|nr:hypothetical protein EC973_009131 [Apophysomyces ossiformis]